MNVEDWHPSPWVRGGCHQKKCQRFLFCRLRFRHFVSDFLQTQPRGYAPGLFHLAVFVGVRHLCRPTECKKLPEGRTPTGISLHPKPDERALGYALGLW